MSNLITEQVSENYRPSPGTAATRKFWIAYPPHIAAYADMGYRIQHAAGVGDTEAEALAAAAHTEEG